MSNKNEECWEVFKDGSGTYEINLSRLAYIAITKNTYKMLSGLPDDVLGKIFKSIGSYVFDCKKPEKEELSGIETTIADVAIDDIIRIAGSSFKQKAGLINQDNLIRKIDE